jgi:transposase
LRKWILNCNDHGVARGDLTDRQWARLKPLLPMGEKAGRPRTRTRRQLIDGIRWRTRAGTLWRDVPERYGPWDRVYNLFRSRTLGRHQWVIKRTMAWLTSYGSVR